MAEKKILNRVNKLYYFGKRFLLQPKKPLLSSYKITYRCNLHCLPCPFAGKQAVNPTFLSIKSTLQTLYQRGNRIVIFEGGEPMLWKDDTYSIHDIIAYARTLFFTVGLTTNGTISLDINPHIIWVSIDGLRDTHNYLRGDDIFDQVINTIKLSRHPKIFAHITANCANYTEIPELVRYLTDYVKGITVQFFYPYDQKDDLFLNLNQRQQLLEDLISMKHAGYPIKNSFSALKVLKNNDWKCRSWLVDCVDPDGSIMQGCYLQGRTSIDCKKCGFSPYTEISLAFQGNPGAMIAGLDIFGT